MKFLGTACLQSPQRHSGCMTEVHDGAIKEDRQVVLIHERREMNSVIRACVCCCVRAYERHERG